MPMQVAAQYNSRGVDANLQHSSSKHCSACKSVQTSTQPECRLSIKHYAASNTIAAVVLLAASREFFSASSCYSNTAGSCWSAGVSPAAAFLIINAITCGGFLAGSNHQCHCSLQPEAA
jgi:hypothetical protein